MNREAESASTPSAKPRPYIVRAREAWLPILKGAGLAYLIASCLIFWGFSWSLPGHPYIQASFHADENAAILAVKQIHPPGFNPGVFLWGTALFYQTYILRLLLRTMHLVPGSGAGVLLAGRLVVWASAIGSLTCVFLLGRRLFDDWTGRLAAIALAVMPGFVISSHYFKTDIPMVFWLLAAMLAGYRLIDTRDPRYVYLLGFLIGYCASTKYSGAAAVPCGFVFLAMAGPAIRQTRYLLLFPLLILAGFLFGTPRVLPYPGPFLATVHAIGLVERQGLPTAVARGPALLDYLTGVLQLSLTFPLWLAAVPGLAWFVAAKFRRGLPIWIFLVSYSVLLSLDNWRLVRYTMPLLPFAALAIAGMCRALQRGSPGWRAVGWAIYPMLIYALLFTVSYVRVMTLQDPRVQAGIWIAANLPRNLPVPTSTGHYLNAPQLQIWGYAKLDVGTSVDTLRAAVSPYLVFSEFLTQRNQGALDHFPETKEFFRYVRENYTEVVHFENSQRFLGVSSKEGLQITHDWLYVNPRTTIYRRRTGP